MDVAQKEVIRKEENLGEILTVFEIEDIDRLGDLTRTMADFYYGHTLFRCYTFEELLVFLRSEVSSIFASETTIPYIITSNPTLGTDNVWRCRVSLDLNRISAYLALTTFKNFFDLPYSYSIYRKIRSI